MVVYWTLFLIFAAGALMFQPKPDRTRSSRPLMFAALATAAVIGFRFEVGADWEPYLLIFQDTRYMSLYQAMRRIDPGYGAVNWLAQQFDLGIWLPNLVCASLYVLGLSKFANRQYHPWLVHLVATPYLTTVVAMGYSRQGAAIGLVMAGLAAATDRSMLRFIGWTVLATTFHRSAIMILPIVAMTFSHNRLITIALGGVASILGVLFILLPGLDQTVDLYTGGSLESQGAIIRLAMNTVPALIFLVLRRRFDVHGDQGTMWLYFSWICLGLDLIMYLFQLSTAVDRIALYMIPLQLFVFSRLPYVFAIRERSNVQLVVLVILYSASILFVWLTFASNAKFWVPYDFVETLTR